jgi:hypothetical protein
VIVNGWRGAIAGQRLTVAAGRYAVGSQGVAVVSDAADLEREVPAPDGEGALRYLHRTGAKLVLRSRAGHAFTLDLRTLRLARRGAPPRCPRGALASPRPRLALRETRAGLRPLPSPRSHGFAMLLAILARAGERVVTIEAGPAAAAPCGLAARSVAARVTLATPRPIVSVVRRTFLVARFRHGWRVWRVVA